MKPSISIGQTPLNTWTRRIDLCIGRMTVAIWIFALLVFATVTDHPAQAASTTIPSEPPPPTLNNPSFECSQGTYDLTAAQGGVMHIPSGWNVVFLDGTPWLNSASMQYNNGSCGGSAHVEKIEYSDSLTVQAQDLEWSGKPGKPFDVVVYQQVSVVPGNAYSLSAWMLSLCGGSAVPNDCPDGYYMAKMVGIDPTGGTDPLANTVIWVEDRRNFIENGKRVGWTNLRVGATAQSDTITLFGRIRSPFQWHGNHAFIDSFSLVVAPEAHFESVVSDRLNNQVTVTWNGQLSNQIKNIPNGAYRPLFDVEYREGYTGDWVPWLVDQLAGSGTFTPQTTDTVLFFRVRARAEQDRNLPGGSWPNHRYPGVWVESPLVPIGDNPPLLSEKVFLPMIVH